MLWLHPFEIKSREIIIIIFYHYCDMMATGCGKIWEEIEEANYLHDNRWNFGDEPFS